MDSSSPIAKEPSTGTHVNPWLIHVNVRQKPLQYCKVISLQLIKINEKKKTSLHVLSVPKGPADHRAAWITYRLPGSFMIDLHPNLELCPILSFSCILSQALQQLPGRSMQVLQPTLQ